MNFRSVILHALIAVVILFSTLSAVLVTITDTDITARTPVSGSRIVFVEDITATWCQYCPAASDGLKDLSAKRDDFRFITLVDDRVPEASDRVDEFNPQGFPTVMFDGGYDEQSGSVSSGDEYSDNIDGCLERDVPDLDISVKVLDMGGAELSIEVEIANNDASAYSGNLRVHIVEGTSRYLDYDGNSYPNSLLGYALNDQVSISAGNTEIFTCGWNGGEEEDLLGDDFADMDPGNIVVYAVLFNSATNYKVHPGLPPKYFTAHYADAVGEGFPGEVGDAPAVDITSPRDGQEVSGDVNIVASVVSLNGIDMVEIKVGQDDWDEMPLSGADHIYTWDSTGSRNGEIRISVRATDDMGLSGIDNIMVNVQNEEASTPPEISALTHSPLVPKEGETIDITLELFLYDTTVTSAEIVVCIDEQCLPPKEMFEAEIDRFTLEIGPYIGGQEISYHTIVTDSDGNIVGSRENLFTIQEGEQPADDDEVPVDDDDTSDDDETSGDVQDSGGQTILMISAVLVAGIILVVVIMILVLGRRGGKKEYPYSNVENKHSPYQGEKVYAGEPELETDIKVK